MHPYYRVNHFLNEGINMLRSDSSLPREYQVILDSIADGVYTVDMDWRVTFFNKAAESITGIGREEAIGKPCFEVLR